MASKKYTLILGILSLFMSAAYSQQNDATYDWRDSSKIAAKNLPQHSEFLNNQYPYPAKPRDMWEVGAHVGFSMIRGDISPSPGVGGGLSLRKALGHTFSLRGDFTGSINRGTDYRLKNVSLLPGNNIGDPWQLLYNNFPAGTNRGNFLPNYQNRMYQFSLDLMATLNNKSHYRGNPRMLFNVFTGPSILIMDVDVNALNAQGQPYNWANSGVNFLGKRKDIKDAVEKILEAGQNNKPGVQREYENNGGVLNGSRDPLGRYRTGDTEDASGKNRYNHFGRLGLSLGAGVQWKLTNKFNIGLEQRFTAPFDDNLDALPVGRSIQDVVSYTNLRFNVNLGSAARKVQPLFWLNPNNFIYNELNAPQHMKLPKPILPDADGDGVTDQFDMEPNTPAGCPVDVRGVSRDTDGDGVPDCRDKELLTPQNCFPVNADGVGNCPEPACCRELRDLMASRPNVTNDCGIGNLPSVQFRSGTTLSRDAQAVLASAAAQIKANPNCRIRVTGHGASDKRAQQLSWDRVNAVITYLVERQGISMDRFIFTYGEEGDPATVDLMGTTEEGPNTVPAPHPNLRRG